MPILAYWMKNKTLHGAVTGLALLLSLMLVGCAGEPAPKAADVIGADLDVRGFVETADGSLRVSGRGGLLLSLQRQINPPSAPAGWSLVGPTFDVTAHDRQRQPVRQLASRLLLRFATAGDRPLTILVHDGQNWQVVASDLDDNGFLAANIDHLTPYAVGAPKGRGPQQAAPAQGTRARPTGARPTTPAAPAPRVTTVVTPAAPAAAQSALAAAIQPIKGATVRVTQATGFTGSFYVTLPPPLQEILGAALSAGGAGYYGIYSAVNEAVTIQAAGGSASGVLTLLVEPKTTMPASADEALAQLHTLFPGVSATLAPVAVDGAGSATAYAFYGVSGDTASSVGFVSYEGLALAYALIGSGSYAALPPH